MRAGDARKPGEHLELTDRPLGPTSFFKAHAAPMPLVFVYGTLKRGDCRHRFLAGSRFLGLATTAPGYRLFHLGEYPALIEDSSGGQIEGEIYEVSDATLQRLDDVEGVADTHYVRRRILLMERFADAAVEGYLYAGDVRGKRELIRRWEVRGR